MRASLPPSPVSSPSPRVVKEGEEEEEDSQVKDGEESHQSSIRRLATSEATEGEIEGEKKEGKDEKTPTKVLEVGSRL